MYGRILCSAAEAMDYYMKNHGAELRPTSFAAFEISAKLGIDMMTLFVALI